MGFAPQAADRLFESFYTTKMTVWGSDSPLAGPSSRVIMVNYGQR